MNKPNLVNRQILVVEDEEMNWYLLRDIIEMYQGTALWADSGMKAIDIISKNNFIDLVLIDLKLPFMSGSETIKKIRQINPDLPIIVQTAFAEPEKLSEAVRAGCNAYILKPVELMEVYKIFNDYLK